MRTKVLVQTMRILWFALSFSIVLLVVVMHLSLSKRTGHVRPIDPTTQTMLIAMGGMVAILSFVLPARVRVQGVRLFLANQVENQGRGDGTLYLAPKLVGRLAARVQTAFIMSLALSEAVGLFGFCIGFLNGSMIVSHALLGSGLALALLRFPSRDTIFAEAEKQLGRSIEER